MCIDPETGMAGLSTLKQIFIGNMACNISVAVEMECVFLGVLSCSFSCGKHTLLDCV